MVSVHFSISVAKSTGPQFRECGSSVLLLLQVDGLVAELMGQTELNDAQRLKLLEKKKWDSLSAKSMARSKLKAAIAARDENDKDL